MMNFLSLAPVLTLLGKLQLKHDLNLTDHHCMAVSWQRIVYFVGLLCFDFPEFRITSLMFDFKVLDSRDWGRGK